MTTGNSLCSNSHREIPVMNTGSLQWEQGFPVMKTGLSLWEFTTQGKPCSGPVRDCSVFTDVSHTQESVPAWISSIWFRYKMWRNVGFVLKIAKSGLFSYLKLTESNNNIYFFSWFSAHELICGIVLNSSWSVCKNEQSEPLPHCTEVHCCEDWL